jgi:L-ascorbate metabolism protein UlaG (beta-lactamase superfamily)
MELMNRYKGCLLGLAVGDAIGTTVEFKPRGTFLPVTNISFRWLGVAGIELAYNNQILLIDPYLTRIPFWRQWIGTIQPDQPLVNAITPRADFVLITHAHYDHLLDVPVISVNSGVQALGSYNTVSLLKILGVPEKHLTQIAVGDNLVLGDFHVQVYSSHHGWTPGFTPGPLLPGLRAPLRARDYRMDNCLSYLITINNIHLLVSSGEYQESPPPAEVLFANPVYASALENTFLQQVHPRLVIPIHWDNFWRPLKQPVRPILRSPSWKTFPPLQPVDLQQFQVDIARILPETNTLTAERLRIYNLLDWL